MTDREQLRKILEQLAAGECSVEAAFDRLRVGAGQRLFAGPQFFAEALAGGSFDEPPIEDLGHTVLDTEREHRCGTEEVVFAHHKSTEEVGECVAALHRRFGRFLVTRATPEQRAHLLHQFPASRSSSCGRTIWCGAARSADELGGVAIVSAGTSDSVVAEEAECTVRYFGGAVIRFNDVGVAGIHRLFRVLPELRKARVVIVAAGMDGALPSVVGGLTAAPVIAVPTSVGYGANFGGITALLAMLVSCAPGTTVVNIDNGFGAAISAVRILRSTVER